jgi:hypothetical protein
VDRGLHRVDPHIADRARRSDTLRQLEARHLSGQLSGLLAQAVGRCGRLLDQRAFCWVT